jgi:hypothetical protein
MGVGDWAGTGREGAAMEGEQADYLSYLVRLWRAGDGEEPAWRAVLKSSQTGQQVGFGSLEALFDYVRAEAGLRPAQNGKGS